VKGQFCQNTVCVFNPLVPKETYCVSGCWVYFRTDAEFASANLWPLLYCPVEIVFLLLLLFFCVRVCIKKLCNLNPGVCRFQLEFNSGNKRLNVC
jgi:hypothetical protein